ncbi:hypothetical protein PIB30_074639 [Stylosanthes scabra]|uniref:Retrotransposon Copia-like N-terminal domain-containing protein n=1 Tax=Stylosanthes scabra TaxID=79078 RepID=A0ABU6WN20_9FABA|nr:hypothetical protein [Stylosanthes scabra]
MALIVSLQLNLKNALVPLSDKLDENNFSTWQKSVLLTLRTLKLIDHLSYDKIPPQYESVPAIDDESDSASKTTGEGGTSVNTIKKTLNSPVLQESVKYTDWI